MCGCVVTRLAFTNSMVGKRARGVGREDREALVRISKLGRNVEMYSRTLKSATGSRGLHVETNYLAVWSPWRVSSETEGWERLQRSCHNFERLERFWTPEHSPWLPPSSLVPLDSFYQGPKPWHHFQRTMRITFCHPTHTHQNRQSSLCTLLLHQMQCICKDLAPQKKPEPGSQRHGAVLVIWGRGWD